MDLSAGLGLMSADEFSFYNAAVKCHYTFDPGHVKLRPKILMHVGVADPAGGVSESPHNRWL